MEPHILAPHVVPQQLIVFGGCPADIQNPPVMVKRKSRPLFFLSRLFPLHGYLPLVQHLFDKVRIFFNPQFCKLFVKRGERLLGGFDVIGERLKPRNRFFIPLIVSGGIFLRGFSRVEGDADNPVISRIIFQLDGRGALRNPVEICQK